jgi:hypothetical protein
MESGSNSLKGCINSTPGNARGRQLRIRMDNRLMGNARGRQLRIRMDNRLMGNALKKTIQPSTAD